MNIYRYSFTCRCPTDKTMVTYHLTIESPTKILAEDIRAICAVEEAHQEDLADKLIALGGVHSMTATHAGVTIETRRP
ncbi:hypothetical protein [Rhizobium phage RHph_X2_30]|nr:hypothetical protein [Rhizobium phage RHph_X2_30]